MMNELVKKYDIRLNGKDQLAIPNGAKLAPEALAEIKAAKPAIIAYFIALENEKKAMEIAKNNLKEEKAKKANWYVVCLGIGQGIELWKAELIENQEQYSDFYKNKMYKCLKSIEITITEDDILAAMNRENWHNPTGYGYGESILISVSNEVAEKILILENERKNKAEQEVNKNIEIIKNKYEKIVETAKLENKPQVLKTYTVDCNDCKEECNTDIMTEWVMPDGTTKTTSKHTW